VNGARWLPVALWVAVILTATSIPAGRSSTLGGADKLAHFTLYFVLGLLTARARPGTPPARLAMTVVAIALFAAVDEWHQRFIPGRSVEVADWVADVLGASAGIAAFTAYRARRATDS
jgi:VanZ family protein